MPTKFYITDILKEITEIFSVQARAKGLELSWAVEDPLDDIADYLIKTDKKRLNQVLLNLVSNSLKFTQQGSITIQVAKEDDKLVCSITDTGSGISPKDQR